MECGSPTGSSQDCKAPCRWPSHNREGAWAPNDCEAQRGPTTSPPGPGSLLTERKPLCVRLLRFGGCWNQQSACYNKYALLRDTEPTSTRVAACSLLERAPGGPGLRPAFPSSSLGQGDGGQGARTTHHNLGSTNSQKTLLFQVAKCYWSLWGTWQGGGRPEVGPGSTHYKNQRLL